MVYVAKIHNMTKRYKNPEKSLTEGRYGIFYNIGDRSRHNFVLRNCIPCGKPLRTCDLKTVRRTVFLTAAAFTGFPPVI